MADYRRVDRLFPGAVFVFPLDVRLGDLPRAFCLI